MPAHSKKRPRETANLNTGLVEIYEDLASENSQIRLDAALRLLSAKYTDAELVKILTRLFRGLCSSRKAARLGFSVALTEFLIRYVTSEARFSIEQVLLVFKEQTEPIPGASGQELRDYHFGRLFAAEALIKSKVFLKPDRLQSWSTLVEFVLELYHKKQWLQEECGWVLQQALVSLRYQPAFLDQAWVVFEQLEGHRLIKTLEGIALWITFWSGDNPSSPFSHTIFKNNNPLDAAEKTNLLNALKAVYVDDDGGDELYHNSGSTWSNKLHFAWIVIFEAAQKVNANRVRFSDLWTSFVDEYLFANAASEQKKYWGFLMVQHFIENNRHPSQLMGLNFQRCFCNQLSKAERHLHGIAMKTMKAVLHTAEADEEESIAGDILVHMVRTNSWVDFDKITKTKFVEKLLTMTSSDAWDKCLGALVDSVSNPELAPRNKGTTQFRIACADLILTAVKNYGRSRTNEAQRLDELAMENSVETLASFAFCQVVSKKGDVQTIDEQTKGAFRGRLLSTLSHLMTQTDDPSTYPAIAAAFLLTNKIEILPISPSSKTILASIKRAGKKMMKCGKHTWLLGATDLTIQKNVKVYRAFRLLFALTIIQAFCIDADALNLLEELEAAYDAHLDDNGNVQERSSGFVEILLSLVSKPSVLFRRVGKEVFSSCTAMVDQEGLDSMFDVLLKSEDLAGQQELFDAEDDAEEEIRLDIDEVSHATTPDSDTSSVMEETMDNEVIEFENKLAQALGTHRAEDELVNGDAQESDEEMMDDEQMEALDPMMSNMFKERKMASHKKETKNARDTIVQFKTKVLELLEIYVQQESKNPQNSILATIPTQCIACIQVTKSKQVSEKAAAVVKAALNAYKLSAAPEPHKQVLKVAKQELRSVHQNVLKPGSNLYLRTCSQASLFLAKMMLNNNATVEKVWKEYNRTGEKMAASQDVKVVGALFQDWFNWLTNAKATLSKRAVIA